MINYHDYGSTTTTGADTWSTGWTGASSTTWYYTTEIRKYLVTCPENWGQSIIDAFCRLVNDDTDTGFSIDMIICGDIKITDPNIDVRDMESFRLLFKSHASVSDKEKIDAFFNANPIGE